MITTLLAALEACFENGRQAERNRVKLKNRVRKREEGLTELAEDVEKLIRWLTLMLTLQ
jgi:hypothetical protein